MPVCKICQKDEGAEDFPTYSVHGKSGRRRTCRQCWNARWSPVIAAHGSRYYNENVNGFADKARARTRAAYAKNKEGQFRRNQEYATRHPDREAARIAVKIAVRSGKLAKQPCARCGALTVDAHHEDYSAPLAVIWLCRKHHGERHQEINRAGAMLDGVLHRGMPA